MSCPFCTHHLLACGETARARKATTSAARLTAMMLAKKDCIANKLLHDNNIIVTQVGTGSSGGSGGVEIILADIDTRGCTARELLPPRVLRRDLFFPDLVGTVLSI